MTPKKKLNAKQQEAARKNREKAEKAEAKAKKAAKPQYASRAAKKVRHVHDALKYSSDKGQHQHQT